LLRHTAARTGTKDAAGVGRGTAAQEGGGGEAGRASRVEMVRRGKKKGRRACFRQHDDAVRGEGVMVKVVVVVVVVSSDVAEILTGGWDGDPAVILGGGL
jgi:hypothetical protein